MTETMLITTHEVAGVLQGGAMMCRFESGTRALLRADGTPLDPQSLAEQEALEDNLPIVQLTQEDAWHVACGRTALVETSDGHGVMTGVMIRVTTPEELLAAHAAACAKYGDVPRMSYADAVRLTATLPPQGV